MYNKLDQKAKKCMFVATLIRILITSSILVIGYFIAANYVDDYIKKIILISIIGIILVDFICLFISPNVRYKRYKYLINNEKIDIVEGFIFISRHIVPIERVHKLEVNQGPVDRYFGLGKVIVTTAGGEVIIRFLEMEKADEIADSLKTKINDMVKSEKQEGVKNGQD